MLCEICVHKNVCRYKTEFENLKDEIAKYTPTYALDRYVIKIECKNFRRGTTVQRPAIDYDKFPGDNGLRNSMEKEETL